MFAAIEAVDRAARSSLEGEQVKLVRSHLFEAEAALASADHDAVVRHLQAAVREMVNFEPAVVPGNVDLVLSGLCAVARVAGDEATVKLAEAGANWFRLGVADAAMNVAKRIMGGVKP